MLFDSIREVVRQKTSLPTSPSSPYNAARLPATRVTTALLLREPQGPETAQDRLTTSLLGSFPFLAPLLVAAMPIFAAATPLGFIAVSALAWFAVRFLFGRGTAFAPPKQLSDLRSILAVYSVVVLIIGLASDPTVVSEHFAALYKEFPQIKPVGPEMLVALVLMVFCAAMGNFWPGAVPALVAETFVAHLYADPSIRRQKEGGPLTVAFGPSWPATLIGMTPFVLLASALYLWRSYIEPDEWGWVLFYLIVWILAPVLLLRFIIRDLSWKALVHPFLFYDGGRSSAPGVFRPYMPSLADRRKVFLLFVLGIYAFLVVSLQAMTPMHSGGEEPSRQALDTFEWSRRFVLERPIPPLTKAKGSEPFAVPASESTVQKVADAAIDTGRIALNSVILSVPFGLTAALILYATSLPMLIYARVKQAEVKKLQAPSGSGADEETPWQLHNKIVARSPHTYEDPHGGTVKESDHIFVGTEPSFGFPVLLHKPLLREHCYIVGDSGSGKTALGLTPLLLNLIKDLEPMVILDLKGDPAMYQSVKREAAARGRDFRFFRPDKGASTYHFDPISNLASEGRSEMEMCQLLLDALSLNHGEGYGRSYYSKRSRSLLLNAMDEDPKPKSLRELVSRLESYRLRAREQAEAFELLSTIGALALYPALEPAKHPDLAINMPSVLTGRQIAYFWLPAAVESMSVREIGKLAIFSLLNAAIDRQKNQLPPLKIVLAIDEFQRLAGENFKIVLEQARSFGIGVILANQSLADLRTPAADLRPTVSTNTRVKMYFAVSQNEEIDALSKASGEVSQISRSWSYASTPDEHYHDEHRLRTDSFAEVQRPRLTPTDIRRISDHPLQMLLHVSRGSGLTQFAGLPVPVQVMFPITRKNYEENLKRGGPGDSNVPVPPPFERATKTKTPSSWGEEEAESSSDQLPMNEVGPKEVEAAAANQLKGFITAQRSRDRRREDLPELKTGGDSPGPA